MLLWLHQDQNIVDRTDVNMLGIELVIRSTVQSIRTLLNVTCEVVRKRKQSRNRRRIERYIELQRDYFGVGSLQQEFGPVNEATLKGPFSVVRKT